MSFFSKIFKWKSKKESTLENQDEDVWKNVKLYNDFANDEEREHFTKDCLEQLEEASEELERVTFEYNLVTSYLKDTEEIERLPEQERSKLNSCAKKIAKLDSNRKAYVGRKNRITDKQYSKMERLEDEMPSAYEKLKQYEIYQFKIKQDLKKLEGEMHAYQFRKEELIAGIANVKGMTTICGVSAMACLLLLFIMRVVFKLETNIGFLITLVATAITISVLFFKYKEYAIESRTIGHNINKIILLENTVKIRYVNNTQLIEYLRVKFQVVNAKELKTLWKKYQEEKISREKYEKTQEDLNYFRKALLKILSNYHIHDPNIWVFQVEAILDQREMVEIRHNLVVRRQSLRKQMDYNKELAQIAQKEIKTLVENYPEYGEHIISLISKYEERQ